MPDATMDPTKNPSCDQEAWVLQQLELVARVAVAARSEQRTASEALAVNGAIDGAVHGAATEIFRALGLEPSFENIRKPVIRMDHQNMIKVTPGPDECPECGRPYVPRTALQDSDRLEQDEVRQ